MSLRLLLAIALAAPSVALAQETIATGAEGSPPAAEAARPIEAAGDPDQSPEAIGRWARGVLAGAPAEGAKAAGAPTSGCTPPPDRKPHGSVWAGVGTGGYREVGAVVTQPIGDCAHVTIAIDKVEMNAPGRRR